MKRTNMFKDALKQDIEVGSIITYPSRQSSSMWLNFGVVTEIAEKKIKVIVVDRFNKQRETTIEILSRIVVLPRETLSLELAWHKTLLDLSFDLTNLWFKENGWKRIGHNTLYKPTEKQSVKSTTANTEIMMAAMVGPAPKSVDIKQDVNEGLGYPPVG